MMSRRALIMALAALPAGYVGYRLLSSDGGTDTFDLDQVAARLAAAYRAAFVNEPGTAELRALLWDQDHDCPQNLTEQTEQDFVSARTFTFEGWTLSRTEGRIAAILSA